ncbi:Putative V-type ATP synthase subunit I [Candidatus Sulfobium mesophilum]|uniref:V-type ATP synthase subunit I n=1 Tax=Candidatus Sulfobium mesophilum TaxID=2016548 RepID=A0A2U3QFV6_9BACT|nr:Putative V-type ATP synthase subunit I [Candidatus Sulfobium mesophilum]
MSKIEIVGPKALLQDTLTLVRELGIFQIEPEAVGFIEEEFEERIRTFHHDEKTAVERLFLQGVLLKIDEFIALLPKSEVRNSYLEPRSVIDAVAKTIDRHVAHARHLCSGMDALQKEQTDLGHYMIFLNALSSLVGSTVETPDLDFIGLTIRESGMTDHLREAISRITDWKFEFTTNAADDGTLVGLITVEKGLSDKVKKSLSDEHVPELSFPASFSGLSFSEKVIFVKKRMREIEDENLKLQADQQRLAAQWMPIYLKVREWIQDRLLILTATASAFETRMCFFINGWMPSHDIEGLRKSLDEAFRGEVVIEEKEMREKDLDRVPIVLKNRPYFKPFELFTSLLPLPAYNSYDPTPFIGIFFPVFFGMILGDAGYGLVLVILSLVLRKRYGKKQAVADGARILFISSLYAVFFGLLYGEFFGDLPHRLFGIEPLCIERRTAIIPMLCFTASTGVVHVFLGLILGTLTALRKKERREALYKLVSIIIILCIIAVIASLSGFFPYVLARPVVIVILFLTPLLFFTGGLLAPLELLKSIGNIISYVRIMAIGLTSVLLAFVANRLGGLTGDIVTGAAVAGLLHLLNIILGVFSPTIHSLRLHYVEFFSKFVVQGGRRFEPLRK